jgi:hypothetical protein
MPSTHPGTKTTASQGHRSLHLGCGTTEPVCCFPRMKITTPPLLKMRSVVSEDGRWARFFLLFRTGQNAAFSLPFDKIGLFLKAIKSVIRTMADRIAARGAFSSADVAEGLAEAVTIKGVATGRDADTGEKLLWVETIDSGAFAFRLSGEAREMLADALRDDEDSSAGV